LQQNKKLALFSDFLKNALIYEQDSQQNSADLFNFGYVIQVGDGIARCNGLPNVMSGELLLFPKSHSYGMALNLENDVIGVVLFTVDWLIKEGDLVESTGTIMSISVGNDLLGSIINPLGKPLLGTISKNLKKQAIEIKAPGIISRKSVHEPVQTGIKAIDSLLPIGRGQRELIIGDRQTGKTALAIDTILNQKNLNEEASEKEALFCIYVAIGQKNQLCFKF